MGIPYKEWNPARFYADVEKEALDRGIELGFARGFEQGLAEWRELLHDQATFRFDEVIAERLTDLLSHINDSDHLKEIGRWIVSCETGDELLTHLNGSG